MKKTIIFVLTIILFCAGFPSQGYAISDAQSAAIQTLLDDACRISGVPGMSAAILGGDNISYFSSGYADREKGLSANENTLYELASVSKAFTGMGILLLEAQGRLSMTDTIQEYLPWLTLRYHGEPVSMESLTLNHFLHHTSGLTNANHIQKIPQGNSPDMLLKTVEILSDADLAFPPGEKYEYGTVNYDVLGLVIEIVSGQSYEEFMKEQIFQPLGLDQTFLYKEEAEATGQLAQGYRSAFFKTFPYQAPEYSGNKPAGYIISCTKDMARWMGIQMGAVRDIPEIFHPVIEKSHEGDMSVPAVNGMYYAAGWFVNADQSVLEHPGGNPNFSTEIAILPYEQTAVCLLTNGANTNIELVRKIKGILDGNLKQSYQISGVQLMDIILSSATVVFGLSAAMLFIFGLRGRNINMRKPITNKRMSLSVIFMIITAILLIICCILDWQAILVWQTYSILTFLISLILFSASITWFIFTHR